MNGIIKIALKVLTVLEIIFLTSIIFGGRVGFEGIYVRVILLALLPLCYFIIAFIESLSFDLRYKPLNALTLFSNIITGVNILCVAALVLVLYKNPLSVWQKETVRIIPVEGMEEVYYLSPFIGWLGLSLVLLNWIIGTIHNYSGINPPRFHTLLILSAFFTVSALIAKEFPPHFPQFQG